MTGFSSTSGEAAGFSWSWDIRSVNARGLDIRTRMPDWLDGIEDAVRKALKAAVARGNVSVALKLTRLGDASDVSLNEEALQEALGLLFVIATEAEARGLPVAAVSAAEIAQMRGVLEAKSGGNEDQAPLLSALKAQIPGLVADFVASREQEGAAMVAVLAAQVDEVAALVAKAEALLDARADVQAEGLKTAIARIMDNSDGVDADRLAQELALIAVKTDIREELDRLRRAQQPGLVDFVRGLQAEFQEHEV